MSTYIDITRAIAGIVCFGIDLIILLCNKSWTIGTCTYVYSSTCTRVI